ncbi:MAG: DUF2892 domain-containing protein [Chlorobium sp.]|nr:MAG: DUF2892 domain-containing protein [Chlorobium sp.]
MAKNIGKTDRVIRFLIGVVMLLAGFIAHSWWGAVGLVPLVTAITGFCPLYTLLGISTCVSCNVGSKPGKSNARLS